MEYWCHLPDGPTAYFKISNVKFTKNMKVLSVFAFYTNEFWFVFFQLLKNFRNLSHIDQRLSLKTIHVLVKL